jgi:ABC-2 type transport system ATP-binding protein
MNTRTNNHNAVEVRNLEKRFGDFVAVNRINFEVRKGEIFGFLGPNGAGKSTTIRMLCGILLPTSGGGQVGGFDIISQQRLIKQHIGYMSQKFSLYEDLTVEENIDFYSGIYRIPEAWKKQRKDWIVKMAGLENFRTGLTRTLSTGWKQRLALGCAIVHEPQMVFLDEPTSGVDPITRRNFWIMIKEMAKKGITIFVTTHYMDEAENCDRIALIYKGSIIAAGTPEELKTIFMKNDVLEISLPDSQEWIERLTALSVVREAALFGTAIHAVVYDAPSAVSAIGELFKGENVKDYRIKKIRPSLEDVFVSLIEDYDRADKGNELAKS